jgi:hydroxymethylpyrimidine pyrophosphatase-like HAD family hydrolase
MVASDLDGTLLGPDSQLSSRSVEVLRRVRDAGIVVVAATGRSQRTALPRLRPAGVFDWAVCSNGAVLYDLAADRIVRHRPVPAATLGPLVAALDEHLPGYGLTWETPEGFVVDETFAALRPDWHAEPPAVGTLPTGPAPPAPPLTKVLVAHPTLGGDDLLDTVLSLLPPGLTSSWSGAEFVEVTGPGVDKVATLRSLCDQLGIAAAEVVAFGDQRNDLAMLRWAGRGVAMADAHPMVLDATSERAGVCAEDGVAAYLEALLASEPV